MSHTVLPCQPCSPSVLSLFPFLSFQHLAQAWRQPEENKLWSSVFTKCLPWTTVLLSSSALFRAVVLPPFLRSFIQLVTNSYCFHLWTHLSSVPLGSHILLEWHGGLLKPPPLRLGFHIYPIVLVANDPTGHLLCPLLIHCGLFLLSNLIPPCGLFECVSADHRLVLVP